QCLTQKIEIYRQRYEEAARERDNDSQEPDNKESDEKDGFQKLLNVLRRMERYSRNLEFVTALCRIQKKPDPLQILVEGPQELTCEFPELPTLAVTIMNVDLEKREIGFTE